MKWLLVVLLAAAPAVAEDRKLVVTAIEGVLPRADAAALEESVRTEARALQVAIAPETAPSVAAAMEQGAAVAVTGRAVRLEGALAVTLGVVKTGDGARLATERLVGFTLADLQGDGRKKIPRLLRAGLGLEPPAPAAPPAPPAPLAPAPAATVPTGPAAT